MGGVAGISTCRRHTRRLGKLIVLIMLNFQAFPLKTFSWGVRAVGLESAYLISTLGDSYSWHICKALTQCMLFFSPSVTALVQASLAVLTWPRKIVSKCPPYPQFSTQHLQKDLSKTDWWLGAVAHTCNPNTSGGQGG